MFEEKPCTTLPRKAQRKNPDARKPHSGMIVQVIRMAKFLHPGIKTCDSSLTINGSQIIFIIVLAKHFILLVKRYKIVPNRWPVFQPPLPVDAPEHFLNKFFCPFIRADAQRCAYHVIFVYRPMRDIFGELRDIVAFVWPKIKITEARILL